MESYFEINVSFNGLHLFATAPRSIKTKLVAEKAIKLFTLKFPKKEGYEISCTYWSCSGKEVKF